MNFKYVSCLYEHAQPNALFHINLCLAHSANVHVYLCVHSCVLKDVPYHAQCLNIMHRLVVVLY